jgi:hypothetical protein
MDAGSAGWNGHEVQIDFAENASTADAADGNKVALGYLRSNQSMMEVTQVVASETGVQVVKQHLFVLDDARDTEDVSELTKE